MGMSAGGNDGLFKLAENAAPDDDRIMPVERKYLKTDRTVGVNEAIALLKKRKENPEARIEGGLDDDSVSVRQSYTYLKSHNIKISSERAAKLKEMEDERKAEEQIEKAEAENKAAADISSAASGKTKKGKQAKLIPGDLLDHLMKINSRLDDLCKSKKESEYSPVDEDEKKSPLDRFREGVHRVTFQINNMEFTVKCLNMIKDPVSHCLVLAFSDDCDSFFTPPSQSELRIKYDGAPEGGKLFYFGMSFSLKSLGLRFLGFLFDETSEQQN